MVVQQESQKLESELSLEKFLLSHRPKGLQNLVAFGPNGEAPSGATFLMPAEVNQALDWVNQKNGNSQNVYFTVNPVISKINKKPCKSDIACIEYAHLDVDPDCSEGYKLGRERLLGAALKELSATATSAVDSGNGLGAFWRHPEPLCITEGEEINKRLITQYGGDTGTHNADRIMRLPGTINYSGKTKLKKGYPIRTTASVIHLSDRVMTEDFIQSLTPIKPSASRAAKRVVETRPITPAYIPPSDQEARDSNCRLQQLLREDAYLRVRWDGGLTGLTDKSRSGYDMSLIAMLKNRNFTYSEAVTLLVDHDLRESGAVEHFHDKDMRYFRRCWNRSDDRPIKPIVAIDTSNPLAWINDFTVTDEEVAEMQDPEWAVENMVVKGHLSIFCAEPNAGKTTIFVHLAKEMALNGMHVCYVNADVSGGDAKNYYSMAKTGGFELLLPDMKVGQSMSDVVDRLRGMNAVPGNYNDVVFIFDTLKKMTDVINKSQAKELLKTLRSLTTKGMTVVCLAHTNKYKDSDGRPVYEGTGDIRADCDELVYLIPHKQEDGSILVSTDPDKKRCDMDKMTFIISPDRTVSRKEQFVDTLKVRNAEKQTKEDDYCVGIIKDAIKSGHLCTREINEYCKEHGVGYRTVTTIREKYKGNEWDYKKGSKNNRKEYFLINELTDFDVLDPLPCEV